MINRTIKDFVIKELIATGGMAAIYRAVQISTNKIVAIKILHGHLAQDKDFITRFEREAQAAANLKHNNMVDIIDYGDTEGVYFIAMEYVEGKSLKELINSMKFVPHDMALAIAYEICQGLEHAHQKGLVHRDIKPANILIGCDGIIKITDFGLAQAQDLTSITVTGALVGTPAYMSPEQAAGRKVDTRSDIFSLGVVIYEMITGSKPFHGESYSAVIHAILEVMPSKPVAVNPLVTNEISVIIEKMLEKDLDKRYQNVTQISDAIYTYFRNRKVEVTNQEIGEFIVAPADAVASIFQKTKEKHFKRGLYFVNRGPGNIENACSEFEKALYLDPEDMETQRYLSLLRQKKERKVTIEKTPAIKPGRDVLRKGGIIAVPVCIVLILLFALRGDIAGLLQGKEKHSDWGFAYIKSRPAQASIYLDDKDIDRSTPAYIESLGVGEHEVELRKTGYKNYTGTFEIKRRDTVTIDATLEREIDKSGKIVINSKPSGATVFIDNNNTRLKTPCTINDVKQGYHKIKVVRAGYETIELDRNVEAGKTTTISLNLQKIAKSSTAIGKSYLKINVDPWAKIYIDNRYIETTPIARPLEIPSGNHTVKLENPNFKSWQKRVNFRPGETVTLDVKLESRDGYLRLVVKPWADVYIDGKFYETTPIMKDIKLSDGKHTIKLINPSFRVHEEVINIVPNKTLKKFVELIPK